jgi:hypothetical protein
MRLIRLLAVILVVTASGCPKESRPVEVRDGDTLRPEDIGVGKYVFEANPPVGKVMVLRRTWTKGGRQDGDVQETIQYANGGATREEILVFDPSEFPFGDRKGDIRIKAQHLEYPLAGLRLKGTMRTEGQVVLEFADEDRNRVMLTFDCFIEDYAKAKARAADLPELSGTWTHANILKAK